MFDKARLSVIAEGPDRRIRRQWEKVSDIKNFRKGNIILSATKWFGLFPEFAKMSGAAVSKLAKVLEIK